MTSALKKQVARIFPELIAGYHLPAMAEVIAISDPPKEGGISTAYRPFYAADVQLLNKDLEPVETIFEAVPVGIPAAGHERGFYGLPEVGALVAIAWFYGLPERPYISAVLPERKALAALSASDQLWQQNNAAYQKVDGSGNWERATDHNITDKAYSITAEAAYKSAEYGKENKRIAEHSNENVRGIKQVETGALHQLAETVINLAAGGSINLLASERSTRCAGENIEDAATGIIDQKAGKDFLQSTEANYSLKAAKSISQQAGGACSMTAGKACSMTAQSITQKSQTAFSQESGGPMTLSAAGPLMLQGAGVHIGTGSVNALVVIGDFMQTVADALAILATHTHGNSPPPNQSAGVSGKQAAASAAKNKLDSISS